MENRRHSSPLCPGAPHAKVPALFTHAISLMFIMHPHSAIEEMLIESRRSTKAKNVPQNKANMTFNDAQKNCSLLHFRFLFYSIFISPSLLFFHPPANFSPGLVTLQLLLIQNWGTEPAGAFTALHYSEHHICNGEMKASFASGCMGSGGSGMRVREEWRGGGYNEEVQRSPECDCCSSTLIG